MTDHSEYFSRIRERLDVNLLADTFVVLVGIGSVGSIMALELARCGLGHLLLIDGDRLERANLPRHALPSAFVGVNKAEGMAYHVRANVPGVDVGGAPHHLDEGFGDEQIDRLLAPADLVVVATDRRVAQRRIAARALAMDIPAVVPGLYADRGGEVFVQLNPGQACFRCWDDFRNPDATVREVSSINPDAFAVIQHAMYLCIAVLDPSSRHAREMAPPPGDRRPRQLFVQRPGAAVLRTPVTRRPECAGCAVGPSPVGNEPRPTGHAGEIASGTANSRPRRLAAGWRFLIADTPSQPRIDSISVSESCIVSGDSVTLSWRASNATHIAVERFGIHPPVGELVAFLAETTAFQLRAVNPFGSVSARSQDVRVMTLPRIDELRLVAFPDTWQAGRIFDDRPTPPRAHPMSAHAFGDEPSPSFVARFAPRFATKPRTPATAARRSRRRPDA
jgi:molybdopterin/thiamine biosynthesis adenylyltransferase